MSEQAKENFFSVVIIFDHLGEVKRYRFLNCRWETVAKLRKQLFDAGIIVAMTKVDNWQLILPWVIKAFEIYSQERYYNHEHSDLKQTVFDNDGKTV